MTDICSPEKEYAGPTNNCMEPVARRKHKVGRCWLEQMRGSTMELVTVT